MLRGFALESLYWPDTARGAMPIREAVTLYRANGNARERRRKQMNEQILLLLLCCPGWTSQWPKRTRSNSGFRSCGVGYSASSCRYAYAGRLGSMRKQIRKRVATDHCIFPLFCATSSATRSIAINSCWGAYFLPAVSYAADQCLSVTRSAKRTCKWLECSARGSSGGGI